jgi:signal transduction histidine kinase
VLHRLRIRAKLTLVAAVPLLCLMAVVLAGSAVRASEASAATDLAGDVRLSVVITNLVHELQRERGLSSGLVGGGYRAEDLLRVDGQRRAVDHARRAVSDVTSRPGSRPAGRAVEAANAHLAGVTDHRAAIDARRLDLAATLRWYTDAIEQYLDATSMITDPESMAGLLPRLAAYGALSRAKEAAALERGMMNGVFGVGQFEGDQYRQFLSLVAAQQAHREVFSSGASEDQRRALDTALDAPGIRRANELERQAVTRPTGELGVRPGEWWELMTVKVDRYRSVEEHVAADLVGAADARAADARRALWLFLLGGLALLGVSFAVAWATARALSRPMRALTARAYRSAQTDLPQVIERLADQGEVAVTADLPTIEVTSGDEVAELASAFNSVQQAAVDLAVDQAMLRRNVAEMFINLGRRNQALIGRQLAFIDRLERDEADPGQLEKLFRLDHMTTRMRRNAESLLVLAGAELPRRWTGAAPLVDVVRAGLSEIEDYARVEISDLGDTAVAGSVATDLTHLLAELLENATTFSPPSSKVEVHGTRRAEGYLLAIVDHGIGMSQAQLADANSRIEELARFDRSPSKLLGLYVVGRLAARHGITVRLIESVTSGVTAKVLVPAALLEEAPVVRRGAGAAPAVAAVPEPAPALVGAPERSARSEQPVLGQEAPPPLQRRIRSVTAAGLARRQGSAGASSPVALVERPAPAVDAPAAISAGGEHSLRALRKRVRGAQLPQTGGGRSPSGGGPTRTADDVGASLSAFQAAVDRGRRAALAAVDDTAGTDQ